MLFFISTQLSCGQKDENTIIGICKNKNDWFNIKKDNKYNAGKGQGALYTQQQYWIDVKKVLNLYTQNSGYTLCFKYEFIGIYTLLLKPKNYKSGYAIFYRIKQLPTTF